MTQEIAMMVASAAFLIWADPDERAKNCAIESNSSSKDYYEHLIVIYHCTVIIRGTVCDDRYKPPRIESIGLA